METSGCSLTILQLKGEYLHNKELGQSLYNSNRHRSVGRKIEH